MSLKSGELASSFTVRTHISQAASCLTPVEVSLSCTLGTGSMQHQAASERNRCSAEVCSICQIADYLGGHV